MKIILSNKDALFVKKLKNHINGLSQRIIFDITSDNKSERVLDLLDDGKYKLSYSRPFFINIFKPPLSEYEFIFSVEKDNSKNEVIISGRVRLKKYIIGAIVFAFLILIFDTYKVLYEGIPFNWFFSIGTPLIIIVLFFIEYIVFRKRIKKFLTNISH